MHKTTLSKYLALLTILLFTSCNKETKIQPVSRYNAPVQTREIISTYYTQPKFYSAKHYQNPYNFPPESSYRDNDHYYAFPGYYENNDYSYEKKGFFWSLKRFFGWPWF